MNAISAYAINKMKGKLNKKWVYFNKKIILANLIDEQDKLRKGYDFSSIKVKQGKSLNQFGKKNFE